MKKDLRSNINLLSAFVECISYTENEKDRFEEHLSVKNFQSSTSLNKTSLVQLLRHIGTPVIDEGGSFIRKGIVGDWVNYFTDEMAAKFVKKDEKLKQLIETTD